MAVSVDIASSLGVGSGINTTQLVSDLVGAARGPKETQINIKTTTNNARISALASAKSALGTFSGALTELLKSADYAGKPVSGDASVASVSLVAGGGTPTGLPAQLDVRQLATAQVLQSAPLPASSAVAGTGTLTIATASGSFSVTMGNSANTLDDLAKAINDKKGGVTASVATDSNGSRLILKGATGEASAFTVTAGPTADANLQRFAFDGNSGTLTRSQTAQNARIKLDNVDMEFASNEVTTAIPFLRIDLNKAAPGTPVTIATDQPTATISDLVQEFVQAYNNVKTALNSAMAPPAGGTSNGLLSSDSGVREMSQRLAKLTNTPLTDTGTYRRLSDLGVSTNRDGTLAIDTKRLEKAIADDPAAVTAMINPTVASKERPGLGGALKSVTDYLSAENGPLASSAKVYDKLKTSLATQLEKLDVSMTSYETQLTKTYSAMQTQLLAFKATQSYLTQQISVWNGND
ncbi:MAG: flagellar filament capping protein FliD [Sphingobium sp.]